MADVKNQKAETKPEPKVDMTAQDNARDTDAMAKATDGQVNKADGPASESSDPVVQRALAVRQTAVMNQDADAIKEADEELVKLGFTEYK